jgi:tetratricopeptide (TPR) repeat protein
MEADATYRPPYPLLGEMLLKRGAYEQAFDLYSKVLTWDGADSDALVGLARCHLRMGRLDEARTALVDAVIYDRLNLSAWSGLSMVAEIADLSIANRAAPDLGMVRKVRGRHYMIAVDESLKDCPVQAAAWITYASERAVWRYEGKYKTHFGSGSYKNTYEEDIDCYMVLAAAWKTLAQQDSLACDRAYLDYLSRVADDGYLVSHVLFDYVCLKAPAAARYFSAEVLARLRDYVNTYVIVPNG